MSLAAILLLNLTVVGIADTADMLADLARAPDAAGA